MRKTAEKATKAAKALQKLLPNRKGPSEGKRRIIAGVASSIMLYGAPVWEEAIHVTNHNKEVRKMERILNLRITQAYRTVSTEALQVIGSNIPLEYLRMERKRKYRNKTIDKKKTEQKHYKNGQTNGRVKQQKRHGQEN